MHVIKKSFVLETMVPVVVAYAVPSFFPTAYSGTDEQCVERGQPCRLTDGREPQDPATGSLQLWWTATSTETSTTTALTSGSLFSG